LYQIKTLAVLVTACIHRSKVFCNSFAISTLFLFIYVFFQPSYVFGQPNPGIDNYLTSFDEEESEYDEIYVVMSVKLVGSLEIPAIIQGESAFLSVRDVFSFLKIKVDPSEDTDLIKGFLINPEATYEINSRSFTISFHGKTFKLNSSDLIRTESNIFLRSNFFGEVFGLDCIFSFRDLSVTLQTKLELPAVRDMKYEKMRQNLMKLKGEKTIDTLIRKDNPLFGLNVANWSLMHLRTTSGEQDTRVNLDLGSIIAGGEANAYLNYTSKGKFNIKDQIYRWRYINNDNTLIKQVVLGNVSVQSISTMFGQTRGIQVSNRSTIFRKSFGTYKLSNITEPGWLVELYVNNELVDYVKADASGFFNFDVPLVYGNTDVRLKFYGPWGEEEVREENIVVPFGFLPVRKLEYRLTAGFIDDLEFSKFSRLNFNYGLSRFMTVGGGAEYLSSLVKNKSFPYLTSSLKVGPNILLTGEHSFGVRSITSLIYQAPSKIQLDLRYVKYVTGQTVIRPSLDLFLNVQEERTGSLFVPLPIKKVSAFSRFSINQVVFPEYKRTLADVMLSGNYAGINTNFTTSINYIEPKDAFLISNLAMTFRLLKGTRFTPNIRYEYKAQQFNSTKIDIERRVLENGFLSFSYSRNIPQKENSFGLSFRYNFSSTQVSTSMAYIDELGSISQSARGTVLYNKHSKDLMFKSQPGVSKGGLVILAFLDINNNNKRDADEPELPDLKVKLSGGQIERDDKSRLVITGLEAFVPYFIEVNTNSFENIAWQIVNPMIKVVAEPNHFKLIEVPVTVRGEVSGTVYLKEEKDKKGLGGIVVKIYNSKSEFVGQAITESDGYYNYLGLMPGKYYVSVDETQSKRLKMNLISPKMDIEIKFSTEGDYVEGLDMVLEKEVIIEETEI
jgi:hypothetical protein